MKKRATGINTTLMGDQFERAVFAVLQRERESERLQYRSDCCQIFWKKAYYSRDRKADITFDIAIEVSMPGASDYSSLVLIECKRLSRAVEIGELEQFFAKMQQIAGARDKGIVVSAGGFQRSALEFAKSKGIGLVRHFDGGELKWQLRRSEVASFWRDSDAAEVERGLLTENYSEANSSFYCASPIRMTRTFNELLADLTGDTMGLAALNQATARAATVPFISPQEIERRTQALLQASGYSGGKVPLEAIARTNGLQVLSGVAPTDEQREDGVLGCIEFDSPATITLFAYPEHVSTRVRFTLAHEIAHYILGHGDYLLREYTDASDDELGQALPRRDIGQLEFQANRFASSLLLPKTHLERDVRALANKMGLRDRGHGVLFVDEQHDNIAHLWRVTSELGQRYDASHAAIQHRLRVLGLLQDARRVGAQRLGIILKR